MIQVTDPEIIGAIHMHHWLKPHNDSETIGPLLDEMLESVVIYYPDTSEVVVDTRDGETYTLLIENQDLRNRVIEKGETNLGMRYNLGACRWIQYNSVDEPQETLSMYVGNGRWLTENSEYVWFYDIESLWEVDVEISQSQS